MYTDSYVSFPFLCNSKVYSVLSEVSGLVFQVLWDVGVFCEYTDIRDGDFSMWMSKVSLESKVVD